MGILALKSMARRPWPEGAAKTHPKCWYEPLATETPRARACGSRSLIRSPRRSRPETRTCSGWPSIWRRRLEPLSAAEAEAIKRKGLDTTPLFKA